MPRQYLAMSTRMQYTTEGTHRLGNFESGKREFPRSGIVGGIPNSKMALTGNSRGIPETGGIDSFTGGIWCLYRGLS